MRRPEIGDVVHFWENENHIASAAIVTRLAIAGKIDLYVFDCDIGALRRSVPRRHGDPEESYPRWDFRPEWNHDWRGPGWVGVDMAAGPDRTGWHYPPPHAEFMDPMVDETERPRHQRELLAHRNSPANEGITIFADPDSVTDVSMSPSRYEIFLDGIMHTEIRFQRGPVPIAGRNGITMEALLAIVADQIDCFQQGPYPCEENEAALVGVLRAIRKLKERTVDREKRGVEGKYEK